VQTEFKHLKKLSAMNSPIYTLQLLILALGIQVMHLHVCGNKYLSLQPPKIQENTQKTKILVILSKMNSVTFDVQLVILTRQLYVL